MRKKWSGTKGIISKKALVIHVGWKRETFDYLHVSVSLLLYSDIISEESHFWLILSWSLGLQGDLISPFWRSALGVLWKEWCWSWNSSTLATSCEELTHWKRLWCWEGLGAGGKGDARGWDGWMALPTQWMWVWVNSGRWWWTGRPGVLQFMGLQRVGHDWALNWTELNLSITISGSRWKGLYASEWPSDTLKMILLASAYKELRSVWEKSFAW